jgi:hypothetical protein
LEIHPETGGYGCTISTESRQNQVGDMWRRHPRTGPSRDKRFEALGGTAAAAQSSTIALIVRDPSVKSVPSRAHESALKLVLSRPTWGHDHSEPTLHHFPHRPCSGCCAAGDQNGRSVAAARETSGVKVNGNRLAYIVAGTLTPTSRCTQLNHRAKATRGRRRSPVLSHALQTASVTELTAQTRSGSKSEGSGRS